MEKVYKCESCQGTISDTSKFCQHCGSKFIGDEEVSMEDANWVAYLIEDDAIVDEKFFTEEQEAMDFVNDNEGWDYMSIEDYQDIIES